VTPQVFIILPTNRNPGMDIRVKDSIYFIIFWDTTVTGIDGFNISQPRVGIPSANATGTPRNSNMINAIPIMIIFVIRSFSSLIF